MVFGGASVVRVHQFHAKYCDLCRARTTPAPRPHGCSLRTLRIHERRLLQDVLAPLLLDRSDDRLEPRRSRKCAAAFRQ